MPEGTKDPRACSALIFLDSPRVAKFGLVRVLAIFAQGAPLPEQIPALVKLHSNAAELLQVLFRRLALLVQALLLGHEFPDLVEDRGIGGLVHAMAFLIAELIGPRLYTPASFDQSESLLISRKRGQKCRGLAHIRGIEAFGELFMDLGQNAARIRVAALGVVELCEAQCGPQLPCGGSLSP
jgi:hypothetical protein